jgi:hypothetical protein
MRTGLVGLLSVSLLTACGSPTSPTPTSGPGATRPTTRWEGTLTRAGASATITITVEDQVSPTATVLLSGSFSAVYPTATYSGFIAGAIDQGVWNSALIPFTGQACPAPLTTASGTTVLMLTASHSRMGGEATLIECEGRTTWTAEFVRR